MLTSCEHAVQDHYRYDSVELNLWSFKTGPNQNCVELTQLRDSIQQGDTIALKISFVREYYSNKNSKTTRGPMYVQRGQKGPEDRIDSLTLMLDGNRINHLLYSDSISKGYASKNMPNFGFCQGENCDCYAVLETQGLDDFILKYNNKSDAFLGEASDGKSILLFFIAENSFHSSSKIEFSIFYDNGRSLRSN